MIDEIKITVPDQTIEYEYFQKILAMCGNVSISEDRTIQALSDTNLKPAITFATDAGTNPAISLNTDTGLEKDCFWIGKLPVGFNIAQTKENSSGLNTYRRPLVTVKTDNVGEYLEVKWPNNTYPQFNFNQLYNRLNGKVTFLDHAGVNINPKLLPESEYQRMKNLVASSSYLLDYPYEREWPFIIPVTSDEKEHGLKLNQNRDPKFEFVDDFIYPYPEIQIDLQTNLSQEDTLALFPPPYGYFDPDPINGGYWLSVFMYTGWESVSLRVDVRFRRPEFNHNNWLIQNGHRVRS